MFRRYPHPKISLWQCACDMIQQIPRPTPQELNKIYDNDGYYKSWGITHETEDIPRSMKQRTFSLYLKKLSTFQNGGKVLDIGCATGFFLEVANFAGWDVYGVEISKFSSNIAYSKFGERVYRGTLEQAGFESSSFDLITMIDLIEHIPDLLSFLREVHRILKPSGRLLIVTPNTESLSARLMRGAWSHFKTEHLYYFSPKTIGELLRRNGFGQANICNAPKYFNFYYISHQYRTYYPSSLFRRILNALDFFLSDTFKRLNFKIYCGEMLIVSKRTP
ncbi:MAG: class I SAM-dependent methyltransferase [Desulfobacterales bacterium]|nr:class I SAM-dependent methyltransferase [Desulfobacterales bacterium]